MKYIFYTLLLCVGFNSAAQSFEPIDRKKVEAAVTNDSLDTYYPKLMARMASFDTTLTADDYRLIYYGFVFQSTYSAYANEKGEEINKAFEKENYEKVIKYCDEVLAKNPTALKKYYNKLVALSKLDRRDAVFYSTRDQYSALITAILSSGDGLTCETAFKVISVSDEYELMYGYFEVEKVLSQALMTPCDLIHISKTPNFPKDKMYFDVSECFLSMNKMFKEK